MVRNISGQQAFAKKFTEFENTIKELKEQIAVLTADKEALLRENETLRSQLDSALNSTKSGVIATELEKNQ